MSKKFLPLLAEGITLADLSHLRFPVFGSYKYDGIRALGLEELSTRKLKLVPNVAVRKKFAKCTHFDGELIVGNPTAPDVYNRTSSIVMTRDAPADSVAFYVFDYFKFLDLPYRDRRREMELRALFIKTRDVFYAPSYVLKTVRQVLAFEERAARLGYEGIILRSPGGIYKCGRSTLNQQIMLKLKRFEDSEAEILEVLPAQHNTNEAERDERGYMKRSSKKSGKQAMAMVGKFRVRDLKTKQVFKISAGILTKKRREALWRIKHTLPGEIVKYRFQPVGVKELPRFGRFYGFRSRLDF